MGPTYMRVPGGFYCGLVDIINFYVLASDGIPDRPPIVALLLRMGRVRLNLTFGRCGVVNLCISVFLVPV